MDLLDLFAKITLDTSGYEKGLNGAVATAKKVGDGLKSVLGTAAKVSAAAIGVAATGVTALAKSAVDNFAEYEQLVGGVETLFKNNADIVQQYAANAYKTAGLSANAYMETVTSFSASLLQSLGGDTAAAAEVADRAITDMSDNANKMGTDMQMIQNAYQGFAKQNYTMLDNLKLGFGGTKEEMQRLLDAANEYNRQQGINTNYQIENYADIVEAIHVVQTEMGITGTTAAEAATTIQGSLSSMGAAWQNLVTGIADENADFETLIDNFVESATTALDNLLPRVKTSLEGIGKLVTELSPIIAKAVPELVNDVLPSIIQAAVDLVTALVNSLVENGDMIANTALDILDMLVQALVDNAYKVADGATSLITTFVVGISQRLPDLIPAAIEIITQISEGIANNTDKLISAAIDVIKQLADFLATNAYKVIDGALSIITSLADGISELLPDLVPAAVEIILAIAQAIIDNIDEILEAAENIIKGLAEGLMEAVPILLEKAGPIVVSLLGELVKAIPDVIEFAVELCFRIGDYIINYDWEEVGANLYDNLSKAIENALQGDGGYVDRMAEEAAKRIESYSKLSADRLESMITWTSHKIGEYNKVLADGMNSGMYNIEAMPQWMRTAYENSGQQLEEFLSKNIESLQKNLSEYTTAKQNIADALNAPIDAEYNGAAIAGKGLSEYYENYYKNLNESIETGGNNIAETTKKTGEKQKSVLVQNMEALERLYKQREITEDTYQKRRLEYLEKHRDTESDEWTKYYDQVQTYYEKLADTEQKAAEKAAQEREKNFRTILDAYSKQVEQLQKNIDSFADNLTGAYKDFYTFTTKGDIYDEQLKSRQDSIDSLQREYDRLEQMYGNNATAVINAKNRLEKAQKEYDDFQKNHDSSEDDKVISVQATDKMTQAGKQLEEYYNQLLKFQERGIGGDMISQLADFSQEEGLATLKYWNGLTDQEIKNLQAHYDKVANLSNKVSELLHSGEAESTAEAFANQIAGAVENDAQFKAIGELMLSGIIDGLNNGAFDITEAANRIYGALDGYFQSASTVTPPSYTPTMPSYTTAATFPAADRTNAVPQKKAGETPIQSENGISVTINIENFNNYTEDDIDTLVDKILIAIQEKVKQRRVVFS